LLKQGILHPGDIIRFLDVDDEVSPIVITAEDALIDMNGLFYIGIDYENYRDSVNDELFEAVDPDDDEEEDEVDEDEHEHFHLVPEIVSASTIVEFVKMSMSTIKKIGVIIDEIEENED
jgi:putative lipase involved disintegration of autophagic bodies